MNVSVKSNQPKAGKHDYPCLLKSNSTGSVALAIDQDTVIRLSYGDSQSISLSKLGLFCPDNWELFDGEIRLSK